MLPAHSLESAHDQTNFTDPAYYHVILAGLQGGGTYLTGLREHIGDKGWVIASLSTRCGSRRGEYRLTTHYDRMAKELIARSQGRLIRIYAHSLGGLEVLDLLPALARQLEDLPYQTVELFFISPPGIGFRGWRGLIKVLGRFYSLLKTLGLYDQYHVLPLLDETSETATRQRKLFLEEWLPMLVTDYARRKRLESRITLIDAELHLLAAYPQLYQSYAGWYERQRHKLMKGLLEKVFGGQHIGTERHRVQLTRCEELARHQSGWLSHTSLSLAFLGRVVKTLYTGVDNKIVRVSQECRQRGMTLKLGVVILEQDGLVRAADYHNLRRLTALSGSGLAWQTFPGKEHSSVAHNWLLIDALEELPAPAGT